MVDVITRFYANERQAADVVDKLKAAGFTDDSVARLGPQSEGGGEEAAPSNDLELDVKRTYGADVAGSNWLVAVAAPFGRGVLATSILESGEPLDDRLPEPSERTDRAVAAASWSAAAPLSWALGLPVLSKEAAPLSAKFGWPIKSKREYFLTRELKRGAAPLSSALGLPTLTKRRHFLTSSLSREAAPLSRKLGLRLLSNEPAPLSAKFGWSLLKNNPTPLSSALGLPVLTQKQ